MPGLLDLPTELRLAIFKDVFHEEAEGALVHPLLHVCQTTRCEYIDVFSRRFFLYVVGIPGQEHDTVRQSMHSSADVVSNISKTQAPILSIMRDNDDAFIHPWTRSMDLFTFANSHSAWLIEHAHGALISPVMGMNSDLEHNPWSTEELCEPRIDYMLNFEQELEIQPFFEFGLLGEDYEMECLSKEDELLDIVQTEFVKWKTGQNGGETSRPVSSIDDFVDDRRRWLTLAFMRDFDSEGVKGKMESLLHVPTITNTWCWEDIHSHAP